MRRTHRRTSGYDSARLARGAVFAVLLLAGAAPRAQEEPPAPTDAEAKAETLFYRAFFAYRGERRYDEALRLYREFLAAAPEHRHAVRAARDVLTILTRRGDSGAAEEARGAYASILVDPAAAERAERRRRGVDDASDESEAEAEADPAGGEEEKGGEGAEAQPKGQNEEPANVEQGAEPAPPRGGTGERRGRGFGRLDFSQASDAEIDAHMQRMGEFVPRAVERLRDAGEDETAAAAEKAWQELQEAVEGGDKAAAQAAMQTLSRNLRRRRGAQ